MRDFATKLTAPDALHLASAKNAGATLATLDARLVEAARGQGARSGGPTGDMRQACRESISAQIVFDFIWSAM